MQAIFVSVRHNPHMIVGLVAMLLLLITQPLSIYMYLAVAQLIFVPVVLSQIVRFRRLEQGLLIAGQLAVTLLFFLTDPIWQFALTSVYLLTTLTYAWKGIERILQRGFIRLEEWWIDIGLFYTVMGGGWFFVYINGIDTGFSPLITWLTAIHFHYSACLLSITVGLIGRMYRSTLLTLCSTYIVVGPMVVAMGITLSAIIEVVSVALYVIVLVALTYRVWRVTLGRATWFIRLAFSTLCFTIIWSMFYALRIVDIPMMLQMHGFINCVVVGLALTLGWLYATPLSKHNVFTFPTSNIRGKLMQYGQPHQALVDDMAVFIDKSAVPAPIYDFYEYTTKYQLQASVQWARWFKPFAYIYEKISRHIGQLNLRYDDAWHVMEGAIYHINPQQDGRRQPRVWHRSTDDATVFTAIYALHTQEEVTYMNIALPLPFSTMHGILTVQARNERLYLTSDAPGDAGTYLALGHYIMKLPLHEYFELHTTPQHLLATHHMTLFGKAFLHIDYVITKKGSNS